MQWHEAGRRSAMYDIIDVANAAAARPGSELRGVLGEVLALAALVVQLDQPGSGGCTARRPRRDVRSR